jgi:hypothetical protein
VIGIEHVIVGWLARGRSSGEGRVRYSNRFRMFFIAMFVVPPVGFAVLAIKNPPVDQGDWIALWLIMLLFPMLCLYLLIESLRVDHLYDPDGVSYRSPWSARARFSWAQVQRLRWRSMLKLLDFAAGGRTFHFSPLCSGLEGFARTAIERLPPGVLERAPTETCVLQLMAAGAAHALVTSSLKLEDLRQRLGRNG